jgi:hypothetical protein
MNIDWNTELADQLDWHWQNHFRPRLDGLSDDEYLWEPVRGCWNIRPRDAESPVGAETWIKGVRGLREAGLAEPCGPAEGPFAEYSMAALVLHINRECLHHGAEITLLRDLYAWKGDKDGV